MQGHGDRDPQVVHHGLHHAPDRLIAAHILDLRLRDLHNDGGIHMLRRPQDILRPLQVIQIERADGIVPVVRPAQHFFV